VSAKLIAFQKEAFAKTGKRTGKADLVVRILRQFFNM
jgi:hypothetical protein